MNNEDKKLLVSTEKLSELFTKTGNYIKENKTNSLANLNKPIVIPTKDNQLLQFNKDGTNGYIDIPSVENTGKWRAAEVDTIGNEFSIGSSNELKLSFVKVGNGVVNFNSGIFFDYNQTSGVFFTTIDENDPNNTAIIAKMGGLTTNTNGVSVYALPINGNDATNKTYVDTAIANAVGTDFDSKVKKIISDYLVSWTDPNN